MIADGGAFDLTVRDAEVDGRRVDVTVSGGTICDVVPAGSAGSAGFAGRSEQVLDAGGGALIPGLHDHHVHLMAMAAARESLVVDADFAESVRAATSLWPAPGDGSSARWVRAVGYHESLTGVIDRQWLDAIVPDHPIRVQHRSGAMWVLNTAALDAVGIESDDGRLFRVDDELRARLPRSDPDLAAVGRELAGYGVTGVSDLTPTSRAEDVAFLAERVLPPDFPVRVMVTGAPELAVEAVAGLSIGPAKVIVGDHDLPSIDDLVAAYRTARVRGRNVAVHCVTRAGLILALAAWAEVGAEPGDRIEHAAVVPVDLIASLRDLDLTVVTQPSFVCERGDDYLTDVDPDDLEGLWRCGSLIEAGVPVGGSTDAPYGHPDPWRAIASAASRTTSSGRPIGRRERIPTSRALAMFLSDPGRPGGPVRRVARGQDGDLCLMNAPLSDVLRRPTSARVAATVGRSGLTVR